MNLKMVNTHMYSIDEGLLRHNPSEYQRFIDTLVKAGWRDMGARPYNTEQPDENNPAKNYILLMYDVVVSGDGRVNIRRGHYRLFSQPRFTEFKPEHLTLDTKTIYYDGKMKVQLW